MAMGNIHGNVPIEELVVLPPARFIPYLSHSFPCVLMNDTNCGPYLRSAQVGPSLCTFHYFNMDKTTQPEVLAPKFQ